MARPCSDPDDPAYHDQNDLRNDAPEPMTPVTGETLAQAVLLFYRGGPWTLTDRLAWRRLTGTPEATTHVLGDLARAVLAQADAEAA